MSLIEYSQRLSKAIESIDIKSISKLTDEIVRRIDGQGEIHLIGNGGSAANAHHIVGDFSKTFCVLEKRLRINCLSDNGCFITAASNDLDFSSVYEILINTRIQKNDLIIFLSGSGNSMNLVKAARKASLVGIKTASLTGFSGGALKKIVDIPIHVDIDDMEMAEDSQMIIFHYIKQKLVSNLDDNFEKLSKYNKRISDNLIA